MKVYYLTVYSQEPREMAVFLDLDTAQQRGMDRVKKNSKWVKGKKTLNSWTLISNDPSKLVSEAQIFEIPLLTNEITCPLKQFALAVLSGDSSALDAVRDVLKL